MEATMAKRAKTEPAPEAASAAGAGAVPTELDEKRRKALRLRDHMANLKARVPSAESAVVPGLLYLRNFLQPDEERELLRQVDAAPWRTDLVRRVQHYGWRYNYKERKVCADDFIGPLPTWLAGVARRLVASGVVSRETVLDQAIVNEYLPGQGIAAHVDQPYMFGDEIVMVSLGSATTMAFNPTHSAGTPESQHVRLEPRSVARVRGDARYKWKHGIAARHTDPAEPGKGARRIPRERRVSLTFRSVCK
jgi:alkylated DNA repair dioxygenase AlkB